MRTITTLTIVIDIDHQVNKVKLTSIVISVSIIATSTLNIKWTRSMIYIILRHEFCPLWRSIYVRINLCVNGKSIVKNRIRNRSSKINFILDAYTNLHSAWILSQTAFHTSLAGHTSKTYYVLVTIARFSCWVQNDGILSIFTQKCTTSIQKGCRLQSSALAKKLTSSTECTVGCTIRHSKGSRLTVLLSYIADGYSCSQQSE